MMRRRVSSGTLAALPTMMSAFATAINHCNVSAALRKRNAKASAEARQGAQLTVLEVGLGGDAVAEDVDAAVDDRDRRFERGPHLEGVVAVVGGRAGRRALVQRVDDHGHKDVVLKRVGRLAVEHLEAQRDVEAHKLVGHRLRAHAHRRLRPAGPLVEHRVEDRDVVGERRSVDR
eukprot:3811039-Rhodomonas_salina.1